MEDAVKTQRTIFFSLNVMNRPRGFLFPSRNYAFRLRFTKGYLHAVNDLPMSVFLLSIIKKEMVLWNFTAPFIARKVYLKVKLLSQNGIIQILKNLL